MVINVAIFFALGKQIEEQFGSINLVLIFISTAFAGAVAFQAFLLQEIPCQWLVPVEVYLGFFDF